MKLVYTLRGALAAIVIAAAPAVVAQVALPAGNTPYYPTGVGPAVSGTVNIGKLPEKAMKFIGTNFPQAVITGIEEKFNSRTFEVDLNDGTDLEFNSAGDWTEVDAGHGTCLAPSLVKILLPANSYNEIVNMKLTNAVETVKRDSRFYKVELRSPEYDDLRFNSAGVLVEIEMD
ncbi:MAG: PepSY-like domain-containing protein [Candidatus Amulumruptor sp.]|nr:PepSY-like domain-containing protein [Candidatus Amulumruptor sp.]MDE7151897.1 PepSY-like domain-containing protein [Candidatus Amulumruptor sp.]MDE7237962.1 PepSY-like domain-containing protein [Paramuribaculum sp.]